MADLLATHPVLDGHNDLAWEARAFDFDWDRLDIGAGGTPTHTDLPRLGAGGVGGQFWSVYVPASFTGASAVTATLQQIDAVYAMVRRYADRLAIARTADEVVAVRDSGRIASLMGAEGGHCIAESLAVLRTYHRLGVRYLTLTHNENVPWADSATDTPLLGGLNEFGRAVVAELNRLGMLVDLSHTSAETMHAALDVSTAPVIFSHSSARAIVDVPRNVPDDVLTRLAGNGGVCMVTFVPAFVSPAVATWDAAQQAAAVAAGVDLRDVTASSRFLASLDDDPPRATVDDVVAHLEHVRQVAGIDAVGLGGDFDGTWQVPDGLEDVACYPRLLTALAERHWSNADLGKLTWGNALRVLRAAEDVAQL